VFLAVILAQAEEAHLSDIEVSSFGSLGAAALGLLCVNTVLLLVVIALLLVLLLRKR
jgi:hypothetical protein